jgi:glycosyltransferase involved in cell wall biosynthesis
MPAAATISVVIPTLDAATTLSATLASLEEGRLGGRIAEVIVADGGSQDDTTAIAHAAGATVIAAPRGRGVQLAAGAAVALGEWLLFLHADTTLEAGWAAACADFVAHHPSRACGGGQGGGKPTTSARSVASPHPDLPPQAGEGVGASAAYFRFRLDDAAPAARRIERLVAWRCGWLGLPYGDQALLIPASFYRALGGFRPLPLMEDVDLVRRIGRHRLVELPVAAVTSAARYRRGGYWRRPLRNLACLAAWYAGVPPRVILRLYA